jgi:glycosyltransferase involved in cell wall biosynthesis
MIHVKTPLISIVTLTYNSEKTLERTIQSVISQQFNNYEYLIIDGNSSDSTLDIIEKYKEYLSYWISEPDNGIYDAMNKSLNYVRGQWILFLGSDDILLESLKDISSFLKEDNTIYYGNAFFTRDQIKYCGKFNTLKITRKNICHQAIFYSRSVFDEYKYDTKFKLLADYNLNLLLWSDKRFRFSYIPYTVSVFNQYGSCNTFTDCVFMNEKHKILKMYFSYKIYLYNKIVDNILSVCGKILRRK